MPSGEWDEFEDHTVRTLRPSKVPAQRTQRPDVLAQIEGTGSPCEFVLDFDRIVIGRSVNAHVQIQSSTVSRKHLELKRVGPEFSCTDLGSHNGVYLNGVKIHSAVLRDGDVLHIGDNVFVYRRGTEWISS